MIRLFAKEALPCIFLEYKLWSR